MNERDNIKVICEICHTEYMVGSDDDSILNSKCPVCGLEEEKEEPS